VHVCTGVSTQRTENNTSRINETEGKEELADKGFRKKTAYPQTQKEKKTRNSTNPDHATHAEEQ
jgi:hypothetical protein